MSPSPLSRPADRDRFPAGNDQISRPERRRGKSKNNFFTLLDFAVAGLTGSSKRLLRVPLYIGVLGAIVAFLMMVGALVAFITGRPIAGWLIGAAFRRNLPCCSVSWG
jgi:Flp pilus assembly protein TadB